MIDKKGISTIAATVAVCAVVFLAGSGFQVGAAKFAIVDMQRVLTDSNAGKAVRDKLQTELNVRQGVLEFLQANRIATQQQAERLRTLSIKPSPTEAEKGELEQVKNAIKADTKKYNDLAAKPNPTEADRTQFTELQGRKQAVDQMLSDWHSQMMEELNQLETEKMGEITKKARDVVVAIGKKDGYSLIFPSSVAVYGSNDLTDAAIKAIDTN